MVRPSLIRFLLTVYTIFFSITTVYAENFDENLNFSFEQGIYAENSDNSSADFDASSILAPSVCVMDVKSGAIVYSKDMRAVYYPASITKVMTTLLAVEYVEENLGDYSETLTVSATASNGIPYDASNIGALTGEVFTLEEALYAIMLKSANEMCLAVAEYIDGSAENFAAHMTERARELGAYNTQFKNPNGLHDPEHYTTAYDMAIIMKEAIRHEFFVTLINAQKYEIEPTNSYLEPRYLINTNQMINPQSPYYYAFSVGGKTGFTDQAQHTLVSYLKQNGNELIVVVMHDEKNGPYLDTATLGNYGFTQYGQNTLLDSTSTLGEVMVIQNTNDGELVLGTIEAQPAKDIRLYVPNSINTRSVVVQTDMPDKLEAPVANGDVIGFARVYYGGNILGQTELLANGSVALADIPAEDEIIPASLSSDTQISQMKPSGFDVLVEMFSAWLHWAILAGILLVLLLVILLIRKLATKKTYYYKRGHLKLHRKR